MNKNLHDIDKIFRDGLEDHLESAPPGAWDAVNNDLDKKQAFHFKEKYYRLKRMALALLLFVVASIAALFYFGTAGKSKNILLAKDQKTATQDNSSVKISTDNKESSVGSNATVKEPATAIESTNHTNKKIQAAEKIQNTTTTQTAQDNIALDSKTSNKKTTSIAGDEQVINENAVAAGNINKPASKKKGRLLATEETSTNAANEKPATQQLQRLKWKQLASNDHNSKSTTNNILKNNLPIAGSKNNDPDQSKNNHQDEAAAGKNVPAITNKPRAVSPLAAYLYQSPLLLSAIEEPAPGPLKTIDRPPFLNSIQQNDSLIKAYTIAKMKNVSGHSISLMPFVSPNHSFTRLQDNNPLSGPGRNKNVAERDERQGTSFSAGVLVNYGLTKSIIVQSGLVFSSAKTNILPKTIYARPDISGHPRYEFNCASGYSYINPKTGATPAIGDSLQAMGSSSTISYVGVPVSLIYVWQRGKFLLKPGIGVSVNFLTSGKATASFTNAGINQKEIASISGLKNSYVDASVGFGTELMLNRKISIGVRPLLRMALTSINKDTPVKTYQNFLSLETGIKINL